jgi:glyoxylase-like metal-dependent hydrolase (beta-lactamase superfamily II)
MADGIRSDRRDFRAAGGCLRALSGPARGLRRATRIGAVAAAIAIACLPRVSAEADKYEVYAVRFATIANFPVSSLVAGADRGRRMDIAMTLWVLKGADGRIALVDTGFHRQQYFTRFAVRDFVLPSDAIAPLGITPDQVSDIFISHMHWDHAGGIDLFPSARVWLQKDEYDYYTGEAWQASATHGGIDPADVLELVKRNTQGKVTFLRGDDDFSISGLTFGVGGKHTFASQFVTAQTRGGTVVLASDNMYLYENLDRHTAIAQTMDAASNLRAQDRMRALAASPRFVIPGHDPAVFDRFPHVTDRIVRIE